MASIKVLPLKCNGRFGPVRICDLEYGNRYYFHDFTGENQIRAFRDKDVTNHGHVVGKIKNLKLYLSDRQFSEGEWNNFFITINSSK